MSWDLSRRGPTHDEIGLGHPGVSFTSPKSLACNQRKLGGETSVLRTFRMSGKEFVKERVSEGKS